jgi:heat shock protein HtpX
MKRIALFLLTNIAVLAVLSIVTHLLGVDRYLTQNGLDMGRLLVFSAVIGFGGSLISLALSKTMAKAMMGAKVIDQPRDANERWLFDTVRNLAAKGGIAMPEVAVFESPDPNAFATGARRDSALVAVSTGLLQQMNRDEVEAVLGHEITHVANGDMVTLALMQGVLNTFVFFLSRVIGYIVDGALSRGEGRERSGGGIGFFITSFVAQIVLGFLASMILMWFSRHREFRADSGGANLAGRAKMIAALERLKSAHEPAAPLPRQLQAFGISGGGGLMRLFMSHPPLDERIAALRAAGQPSLN